jgi:hypothetical protein
VAFDYDLAFVLQPVSISQSTTVAIQVVSGCSIVIPQFFMRGRKQQPPDKPDVGDAILPQTPPGLHELGPPSPSSSRPSKRIKRQDGEDRNVKNKTVDFFVTKQTLRMFCRPEAAGLMWDECIQELNQAVSEAYLLANFYALRQLAGGRPLCSIDYSFHHSCLSLLTSEPRRGKFRKYLVRQAPRSLGEGW